MENKDTLPIHLKENNWMKELNHKLWITKGARFEANNRLKQKASLSNMSMACISSYLIIINLIPLFFPSLGISQIIINFFTTALSILLLVFTQIESSNEYKLNAHYYHSCALKIANLYNDLRIVKEIEDKKTQDNEMIKISEQYKEVLSRYENHEPIDTDMFKSKNLDYYKLSWKFRFFTTIKYQYLITLKYYIIIFFPLILFLILFLLGKTNEPI